jgi:tetratricopeptide (TPR) repeat protein
MNRSAGVTKQAVLICSGLALGLALLSGCASVPGQRAMRAMYEGDYARAVPLLTAQTVSSPDDGPLWARLGEAQYHTQQFEPAKESFHKALSLSSYLPSAELFLGYIGEQQDSVEAALTHYQRYLNIQPDGSTAKDIAKRIETLRRERAVKIAQAAIAREREINPSRFSDSTIGVAYFNSERLPENLRPLSKGLAEMLVTDLSKLKALKVVERTQTERILTELKLAQGSFFDSTTTPRLGKLLGAAHMVGGDAVELSEGRLRFDPQLVSTKTGDVDLGKEQTGELAQFFQIEKRILWDILKKLRIEPTITEKLELDRVPTESFVAFLAYSRGLDDEDAGRYGDARREYDRAASVDPSFKEARDRAERMTYLSSLDLDARPERLDRLVQRNSSQSEWTERPARTDERLGAMNENSGLFRPMGSDRGGNDSPYTPPSTNTTVIIQGHFDNDPQ